MMAEQPKSQEGDQKRPGCLKTRFPSRSLALTRTWRTLRANSLGCRNRSSNHFAAWRDDVSRGESACNRQSLKASVDKAERRAERERELAAKQTALPTKKYGVIIADPEWRFEPWSRETGMDRAADNHYPTSALEVIKSRDVASIAADDACCSSGRPRRCCRRLSR